MRVDVVRKLLGISGVALLVLLALPASAQNAPRIGFIVEPRIHAHAKAFSEGQAQVAQMRQKAQDELDAENGFKYLIGPEAARAVELDKKSVDRTITPQEADESRTLRQRNSALDIEFLRLFQKADATPADTARLRQLQDISDKRKEEIQAKSAEVETRLRDETAAVQKKVIDLLVSAVKQVRDQYQLDIVLNTYIPSYPVVSNGDGTQHEHDYGLESVVYYGGLDVTDKVITIMNGGEAPPPLGPDEDYLRVPGSQVAQ